MIVSGPSAVCSLAAPPHDASVGPRVGRGIGGQVSFTHHSRPARSRHISPNPHQTLRPVRTTGRCRRQRPTQSMALSNRLGDVGCLLTLGSALSATRSTNVASDGARLVEPYAPSWIPEPLTSKPLPPREAIRMLADWRGHKSHRPARTFPSRPTRPLSAIGAGPRGPDPSAQPVGLVLPDRARQLAVGFPGAPSMSWSERWW